MRITIIFPGRSLETAKATASVMPLAPCLLAALTPDEHEVRLVDMFYGDQVDYDSNIDLAAITVRTPLAPIAYQQYYVCGPYAVQNLPGTVHHIPQRPSLEKLPMMRRDLLPRSRYRMDSIFTTRGCPNHCRFCPVTDIFGGRIRHRPIDQVVAEVSTLGPRYYNFDDSVFGHPQIVDRPEENRYYLDLYSELARLRPKRRWTGAGGLSAVDYKDGRQILERAAASGLASVAAGLESISPQGQKQSGAWRKLHYTAPDAFDLRRMKENIRTIQSLGIEVRGFFVIGWDDDTAETYRRTLDFCDQCAITPFIFTLTPMPGSQIYREYREQGRLFPDRGWDQYGTGPIVYRHPAMSEQEMFAESAGVMTEGYSLPRIFKRTLHAFRNRPSLDALQDSFFTQLGIRKAYRQLYAQIPKPAVA